MQNELFDDILAQGLDLRLRVTGRSMGPFIKNGETVILRKVTGGNLRCGDIVYFIDAAGTAYLHRIIAKTSNHNGQTSITTKGDAVEQHDGPIMAEQVLAKAVYAEKVFPIVGTVRYSLDANIVKIFYVAHNALITVKRKAAKHLRAVLCAVLSQ